MTSAAATTSPIALVKSLYDAFGRGDIAYILERVAPDCRWSVPGETLPYSGNSTGREGADAFFQKLAASEDITLFEPREFFANGDVVVALGYEECSSKLTGKPISTNWAHVFRTRDGKVVSWETYFDTAAFARAHQV